MCVNAYGLVCSSGHSDNCYFESGINAKGGFGDGKGCRGFYVGRKDANDDKREYLKRRERTKVFFWPTCFRVHLVCRPLHKTIQSTINNQCPLVNAHRIAAP